MKIVIGCDHAGFHLKEVLIQYLSKREWKVIDLGAPSAESVDYPDFVHPLASQIDKGYFEKGILLCGSGNGVAITANKYSNVRCGLCWNSAVAALIRKHNNANILALPARFVTDEAAKKIVDSFLNTEFEGGRHRRRVDKITKPQDLYCQ